MTTQGIDLWKSAEGEQVRKTGSSRSSLSSTTQLCLSSRSNCGTVVWENEEEPGQGRNGFPKGRLGSRGVWK